MDTEKELTEETERWEKKLRDRLETVSAVDSQGEELLENARAYLSDVAHFEGENDMVRAFEAVIWGWSWIEIGERLNKLEHE